MPITFTKKYRAKAHPLLSWSKFMFYNVGLLTKVNIDNDKTWYDTNVEHHYHIFNEKNSELVDLEPSEIDIKIPKKFSKSQIKKIDLVVKI